MLIIKDYKTSGLIDWAAGDKECDILLGVKRAKLKTTRPVNSSMLCKGNVKDHYMPGRSI